MKKIAPILSIIFCAISFLSSCEDFFSPDSKSNYTLNSVFDNESLTEQAVFGIYSALCDENLYSKKLSLYFSMNTDIENISGATDNGRRAIARYVAVPTNSELYSVWKSLYSAIEKANICIWGIRNSSIYNGDDSVQNKKMHSLLAESLALRAILYFDLVKNWGDVPFHTLPSSLSHQNALPRTDRNTILDTLLSDLAVAEKHLCWERENGTTERINKGFVKGMRARIALFRGGYSINPSTNQMERKDDYIHYYELANRECRDVILSGKHALNPSFENVFRQQCTYAKDINYCEPMFELAMGRLNRSELGYYIGTKHDDNSPYGRTEAGMIATPTYFYSFDKSDLRRDVSCAYHNYIGNQQSLSSITTLTLAKWRKEWIAPTIPGTTKYTGINFTFLRYSDILLMYAETENELNNGPTQNAKDALSQVRQRAFGEELWDEKVNKYIDSLTNKEMFFKALVNERAWEFSGESIRKYDLIRWGILYDKLVECKTNLELLSQNKPPYENVPRIVYWTTSANTGDTLFVANIDKKLPDNLFDITSANQTKWSSNISESFISRVFEGDVRLRQFLPIPQQAIVESNGLLINYYGY